MNEDPTIHPIAQRVYARLDQLGMTLNDLAKKANLSPRTLRKALRADTAPSYRTLVAIDIALDQPLCLPPEHFAQIKKAAERIGFMPQLASFARIKARAVELQIKNIAAARAKSELTGLILCELAAREMHQADALPQSGR